LAEETKDKKGSAKTETKAKPVASNPEPVEDEIDEIPEQTISLFLAIGLVVGALIVGLIVGYIVAPKETLGDFGGGGAPIQQQAPQLSPDQLEGGQLPSGHPPIDAPGEAEAPGEAGETEGEEAPEGGQEQAEEE
jgi:hypothetical protein